MLSVQNGESPMVKRVIPPVTPEMVAKRRSEFDAIRAMGGLKNVFPDSVAWQREAREDVVLPGRE